jgi:hypothetical protein
MNTTAPITSAPRKTGKLASGATVSKAHAIRKEVAAARGISGKAISWKSCLRSAAKGTKTLTDAWGWKLDSHGHMINRLLWSGECPVSFTALSVDEATGLPPALVSDHLNCLLHYGFLSNEHGWYTVNHAKRPYAHPFFGERNYEFNR